MKTYILFLVLFNTTFLFAEEKKAIISTSSVCKMCKKTIETAVSKIDGVKTYKLDVTTKKLKVTYDDSKTNLKTIEQTLVKLGYDANQQLGDSLAHSQLPNCCKKGSQCHH